MAEVDDDVLNNLSGILGEAITDTIAWIFFVAIVITVVFGVISWCVLEKFRTFRNYVLLSALVAEMLTMLLVWLSDRFITEEVAENNAVVNVIMMCYLVLLQSMFQYWLLVLCFVFSVDFVKVFHYDVRKKYLWSNLFAWGLPILTVHLYALVGAILYNMPEDQSTYIFDARIATSLILIPVAFSFITYIAVICRLIYGTSKNNFCGRFTIATAIFLISNVILLTIVPIISEKESLAADVTEEILEYLLIIALIVFVIILKSNWKLWRDYLNKPSGPETGVMLRDQRV